MLTDSSIVPQARNVILANTFEYRYPTTTAIRDAALHLTTESLEETQNLKLNMTSRFIGLVVVPGQHITRIELEENPQQSRVRESVQTS
jgi:hypothetical protein